MVVPRRAELGLEGGFDFFSDALDFFGNVGSAIWDGACSVMKAIVQGASLVLEVVIDSIHFLYSGIIDTIDRILDVVGFILDAAGMLLGQAIGWLLEQLGFLFDWKAIKRRRDALKTLIFSNAGMFTKAIPDPKGGTDAMVAALGSVRAELQMTIAGTMCMVVAGGDVTEDIVFSLVTGFALTVLLNLRLQGLPVPKWTADVALLGAAAYFLYKVSVVDKKGQLIAYHSISLTQQVLTMAVRLRVMRQKSPLPLFPQATIYGGVQGLMALAKMTLYATMI